MATRLGPLAGPVPEDAIQHVERRAHPFRLRVRPEVDDAPAVPLAREQHAWKLVAQRDRDVWERLVVAQPHVERRPVALDEVLLEVQRLDLVAVTIASTSWIRSDSCTSSGGCPRASRLKIRRTRGRSDLALPTYRTSPRASRNR